MLSEISFTYYALQCSHYAPRLATFPGAYAEILKRGFHYSKVTVILDYLTALLEYLDHFTKIIIQNNAISVAIMFKLLFH